VESSGVADGSEPVCVYRRRQRSALDSQRSGPRSGLDLAHNQALAVDALERGR
jgi:hypothetical protein